MADVRFLSYPKFHAEDGNGKPLVGGKLNVYAAGTTDRIDTWTDFDQTSKNTNPVILNSRGEADVFFDAPAKLVLTDKNDVTIWTLDDISPLNAQTITGKYNLVENGSFELDGDGDGNPDSWDIVETTSTSTIEIDTGSVAHGTQALKFASAGGGGGTATTSSKFSVVGGSSVGISFFVTSTSTTATNKVDLITYDKNGGSSATQNIYTSSGTAPTSFEQKFFSVSIPSGKTQAELKLTGVDNAATATSYFDFVQVVDQRYAFTGTAGEVTASASELNTMDGITASTSDLNNLDGSSIDTDDMRNFVLSGEVRMYAGSSEPSGWLFCSGQAVSRTTFSKLFNTIGTTYGNGDGSTTFNVPDLRDRSPLGDNTMGASDAGRVTNTSTSQGDSGGEDEHTLTISEMPSHDHDQSVDNADGASSTNVRGGAGNNDLGGEVFATGGDGAHNNMHPFLAINFIIKT